MKNEETECYTPKLIWILLGCEPLYIHVDKLMIMYLWMGMVLVR